MKTKLPILLFFVAILSVFSAHAYSENKDTTIIIPLSITDSNIGNFPSKSRPDTIGFFTVTLNHRQLTISTKLEGKFSIQINNHRLHKRIARGPFTKSYTYEIPTGGAYSLTIKYQKTTFSGSFDVSMTQDEAAKIVLKAFEEQDVNIFLSKRIFAKTDTLRISAPSDNLLTPPFDAWIAFVDLYPDANWAHPCQYILIHPVSGDTIVKNHRDPPMNWSANFDTYRAQDPLKDAKIKTPQEAFNIADSIYKGQVADIWVAKSISWGNHKFELPMEDYVIVPSMYTYCWVVFVDLRPMTLWEHPCEYLFIDPYYGTFTIIEKEMFPLHLEELFTHMSRYNNQIVTDISLPQPENTRCNLPQRPLYESEPSYKVLIDGKCYIIRGDKTYTITGQQIK